MGKYGIALTTFENEQQAKPIIDEIIKCKLAACVQEIMIKSHYTWKGNLCREDEVLVLFKTRKDLYPELERKLLESILRYAGKLQMRKRAARHIWHG